MPVHTARAQLAMLALLMALCACSRMESREAGASEGRPRPMLAGQTQAPDRRPLLPRETTTEIEQRAKEILDANLDVGMGTEVPFEVGGRSYVARIEEHYHEPGGPRRPWGRHRGVTVYHAE